MCFQSVSHILVGVDVRPNCVTGPRWHMRLTVYYRCTHIRILSLPHVNAWSSSSSSSSIHHHNVNLVRRPLPGLTGAVWDVKQLKPNTSKTHQHAYTCTQCQLGRLSSAFEAQWTAGSEISSVVPLRPSSFLRNDFTDLNSDWILSSNRFLQRDAMLARYKLRLCVRPSQAVFYQND